jgi:Alpha/beta hydrolase domain
VPRDIVAFLRHEKADGQMRPNPLTGRHFAKAIGFRLSQSGRYLRDYLYLGFNEDEAGRVVFEGLMPHIAGGKKSFINYRFGQPGRNVTQHAEHTYPGDQFPFTYPVLTDAVTGRTDWILALCRRANNCPKVMQTDT